MKINDKLGMRAALAAVIGAGALIAGDAPASANGTSADLHLEAIVPPSCSVDPFSQDTLDIQVTTSGLPITDTLSATTTVNCNTTATAKLISERGGMVHRDVFHTITSVTAMANYTTTFDYTADVKLNDDVLLTLDTNADAAFDQEESEGPVAVFDENNTVPDMSVAVEVTPVVPASGTPLMAGTYIDTLTLEVLPAN